MFFIKLKPLKASHELNISFIQYVGWISVVESMLPNFMKFAPRKVFLITRKRLLSISHNLEKKNPPPFLKKANQELDNPDRVSRDLNQFCNSGRCLDMLSHGIFSRENP